MPYEDACLDFPNPETVKWYQEHLRSLLEMGVGAIKADFGEGAPYDGFYANGRGGLYEHNLYPVRYNKAVWEVTKDVQKPDGAVIWARSAWAGSQRYPLHWGGDAANTNEAMLSTLHAGLSFGLSGFPFWSHDIGGFVQSTPEDLYRRWLPFGFLSSHTRSHGAPPTEPWLYNQELTDYYRASAELKYKLMPYVLEQARKCTETGLPMVRALFVEYPADPVAWMVEDQYLFGSDILVAPIFDTPQDYAVQRGQNDAHTTTGLRHWTRQVYLPGGAWVDYQTGKTYKAGWNDITTDKLEAVILVRKGAVIPTVPVAQSTKDIDWNAVKRVKY
jgi:alpha-D-xyloside xylohydrolase